MNALRQQNNPHKYYFYQVELTYGQKILSLIEEQMKKYK